MHVGTIEGDRLIRFDKRRDGFVAFHLPNDGVVAPKGQRFWLRDADVEYTCSSETGCPCEK